MKKIIIKVKEEISEEQKIDIMDKFIANSIILFDGKIRLLQIDTETGEVKRW